MLSYSYMKKAFIGLFAVVALMGAGCADSGDHYTPPAGTKTDTGGPQASAASADPAHEAQVNWIAMSSALVDSKDCTKFKSYFSPELRATLTQADCDAATAAFTGGKVMVDWSKSKVNADKSEVAINTSKSVSVGNYIKGNDGVWYMNSKFWAK
jgi:hypothetical protein